MEELFLCGRITADCIPARLAIDRTKPVCVFDGFVTDGGYCPGSQPKALE